MRALTIGLVVALAASAPAFAGGKGGGGHTSTETPKSSTSLEYGKVQWNYSEQKPDGTARANSTAAKKGRANMNNISANGKGVKEAPITHRKAGGDAKEY